MSSYNIEISGNQPYYVTVNNNEVQNPINLTVTKDNDNLVEISSLNIVEIPSGYPILVTSGILPSDRVGSGYLIENLYNYTSIVRTSGNQFVSGVKNFETLQVSGIPVSVSGHTHVASDITNFNEAVSVLLPAYTSGTYLYVKNATSTDFTKGQAVYVNSAQGSNPTISLAIASAESTSSKVIGLLQQDIAKNNFGYVVTEGILEGVDTGSAIADGDTMWLSPTVSGGVVYGTANKPLAPYHLVFIGYVLRKQQNNGRVFIKPQNGFELGELHNVSTDGSGDNGKFLQYNSASGLWLSSSSGSFSVLKVNGTNVSVSGHSHILTDITDLSSNARSFLSTPSSSNFRTLVNDETGSGFLVFNDSPTFTGIPITPTANSGTNTQQIASTAFVRTEISNLVNSAPSTLDTLNELASALGNDANFATTVTNSLAGKVNKSGDTMTGTLIAPSGKFTNSLTVNNVDVSLSGHTHSSSNITDFNSSVSGLLSTISNSGDNRILTSTGSTLGINAESNLTFDGALLNINGSGAFASGLNISNQTASTIASFDTNKNLISLDTATYPSLTELSYVKGVTSAIQTQINTKQATLTNPVTGVGTSGYLTKWVSASGISSGIMYDTGSRLGILTATPITYLHISGAAVSNNAHICVQTVPTTRTYIGPGNSDTLPFLSSVNNDLSAATYGWGLFDRGSEGDFRINRRAGSTSWVSSLTIQRSDGYVGLGSGAQATAPAERLVVDGNIRLSDLAGNRFQFYRGGGSADDYTIRYGAAAGSYALQISTSNDASTQRCVHFGNHTAGTFTGKTSINGYNGNVGIGTISPNALSRLTVAGSGNTSGTASISVVNSSSTNLFYVRDDGNVGIGTTTPATKLQVNGFISQSAVHASAGLTSDQSIPSGVDTVITMTDKDDPNSWWNASTYRFLPTVSGYYYISAQVNWKADTGTGQINSQLRRNGTTFCLSQNPMVSGITLTQNLAGIVLLNGSTDYVDLTGYSSATDGSQLVTGTSDQAWTKLEAFKIS